MEPISGIILAVVKAIPAARDIFLKVQGMYYQEQIKNIDQRYIKKEEKTSLLLTKIEQAKTHEEKIILFSAYNDINSMSDGSL